MSQTALGRSAGLSAPAICRLERGALPVPSRYDEALRDTLRIAALTAPDHRDVAGDLLAEVERRPGRSRAVLLASFRAPGTAAALESLLQGNKAHERVMIVHNGVGHPTLRRGIYPGPVDSTEEVPQRIEAGWLLEARRSAGLTQGEMATPLGVCQGTISEWEKRGVPPGRACEVRRLVAQIGTGQPSGRHRLPRVGRPSVAELIGERPGTTRGALLARVSRRRRPLLADEIAAAIGMGQIEERVVNAGSRKRIELYLRSSPWGSSPTSNLSSCSMSVGPIR